MLSVPKYSNFQSAAIIYNGINEVRSSLKTLEELECSLLKIFFGWYLFYSFKQYKLKYRIISNNNSESLKGYFRVNEKLVNYDVIIR